MFVFWVNLVFRLESTSASSKLLKVCIPEVLKQEQHNLSEKHFSIAKEISQLIQKIDTTSSKHIQICFPRLQKVMYITSLPYEISLSFMTRRIDIRSKQRRKIMSRGSRISSFCG